MYQTNKYKINLYLFVICSNYNKTFIVILFSMYTFIYTNCYVFRTIQ